MSEKKESSTRKQEKLAKKRSKKRRIRKVNYRREK